MRILMITDFYWPFLGGVEQHVRHLSQALSARGHDVAVATLGNGRLAPLEYDGPVRVHRVRTSLQRIPGLFAHAERPWAPPFPDLEARARLAEIIEEEKPQILHGHDWLARSVLPLKSSNRGRLVMSLHYYTLSCAKKNLMFRESPCSGPAAMKCLVCASAHYGIGKGIPVMLANWMMSAAERAGVDFFLPVSRATAAGNGLKDGDKYQVIPNFIPDDAGEVQSSDAYLAQLPDEPFLLFVGDLRRQKGLHVLLSAYANLPKAPKLVLIGKTWDDTPETYPDNVVVLKNWPNEAVLAAWKRSLIAIVPSIWPEPFGIVIIEAMSSGAPVIASRIGGIPEIVRHESTGLLVPPGDAGALQEAIAHMLANPALRQQMGQEARRQAAAYSASAVVPRIERIYQKLVYSSTDLREASNAGEYHHHQL